MCGVWGNPEALPYGSGATFSGRPFRDIAAVDNNLVSGLVACALSWPQVLMFGRMHCSLAAGAFVRSQLLLFSRRCFGLAEYAFVGPQVLLLGCLCFSSTPIDFALPQVLLFGRGVFRYLTQS